LLASEEFEKYDLGTATEGKEILTEEELRILTDRSEKAYERAEKGLDVEGAAFKVAETKKGEEVLGDLSHK
jgi:ATP-dependent DNA helicase